MLVVVLVVVLCMAMRAPKEMADSHESLFTEETEHLKHFYMRPTIPATSDGRLRDYCREYCPECVFCPGREWTVEGVLYYFRHHSDCWLDVTDPITSRGCYLLWSEDYEHCFAVELSVARSAQMHRDVPIAKSGWLYVDGVRVCPIDEEFYDMDPDSVLSLYRSGEWDGEYPLMSADYSTTVTVAGDDGRLIYEHYIPTTEPGYNPGGLLYDGYTEKPWWNSFAVTQDERDQMVCRSWDTAEGHIERAEVYRYVDVPEEVLSELSGIIEIRKGQSGTYVLTETGVLLYDAGRLVQSWDYVVEPEKAKLIMLEIADSHFELLRDADYIRTGDKIVALRQSGEAEVIVDGILKFDGMNAPFPWEVCVIGCAEGKLTIWAQTTYHDGADQYALVAEDVLAVDVGDAYDDPVMYQRSEGCYIMTYYLDGTHKENFLGNQDLEYYLMQWAEFNESNMARTAENFLEFLPLLVG